MKKTFKLIGLNKPWKAGGFNSIYATVEYGNEDWFHSGFDSKLFSDEELNKLFDKFKNSHVSLWSGRNHRVKIKFDGDSTTGKPVNPIIKKLLLDK